MSAIELDSDEESACACPNYQMYECADNSLVIPVFSQLIIKSQSLTASSTQATEGSNEKLVHFASIVCNILMRSFTSCSSSNANASSSKAALTNPYKLLDDNPSQYSLNIQTPWTNAEVKHLKTVMSSRNYGRKCKSWKDFSNNDWNSWAKRVLPKRTGTDMMNMWLVLRRNKVSKLNEGAIFPFPIFFSSHSCRVEWKTNLILDAH